MSLPLTSVEGVHRESCGCQFCDTSGLLIRPCADHSPDMFAEVEIPCRREGCDVVYSVRADKAATDDGFCSDECEIAAYRAQCRERG